MSDVPEVGKLIEPGEGRRDAIHVCVAPVEAGERMRPGWRVRLEDGKGFMAREGWSSADNALVLIDEIVGIVDPFLPLDKYVQEGEVFWLFLMPGSTPDDDQVAS